ncbi:hypothetical protein OF83DRAFT_1052697 [Amylostereum chailletii]|nr:hypothetical protein OF83DRAFT_1052697 [Amylostereum chailletii]
MADISTLRNEKPDCTICNAAAAIYTCPRCNTRSCSLPCSTTHKTRTGCSGQRDKVKYVPMNAYGLGTLMDDYVYLEDMGRKVADWGKEITRGGYTARVGNPRGGGMRGRGGRGRGRGQTRGGAQKTKRDLLKIQLELRDIDVDMLSAGMERHSMNKSTWDFKNKTALLSVEFRFHPPTDATGDPSHTQDPPYTLLTHRNNFELSLLTLLQGHVRERTKAKREKALPAWIKSLILPDAEVPDTFVPPQCFMPTQLDALAAVPAPGAERVGYHQLDVSQKLSSLLRHKHFVEFPTIDVYEDGAFRGVVIDAAGYMRSEREERPVKRRKLNTTNGKKAIKGLLGEYGSEDDEDEDDAKEDALLGLEEYEGSSDVEGDEPNPGEGEVDAYENEEAEGEEEEVGPVDYAALLDIVRLARETQGVDEDEVDWGDSDDDVGRVQ